MADYIDKIRINGTDYDIKDPNLTEEVSSLKSAFDYTKSQTYNVFTYNGMVPGVVNSSGDVVEVANTYTSDFLSVSPQTVYLSTVDNAVSSLFLVAFYNNEKTFISRILNSQTTTYRFTTPENCYYMRVCRNTAFPAKQAIIENGQFLPYIPNQKEINIYRETDKNITELMAGVYGLESIINDLYLHCLINANNKWQSADANKLRSCILLPIEENDGIEITASAIPTAIAILKSANFDANITPDFVYQYKLTESDIGEQSFEIVTDESGNPVLDTRHPIPARSKYNLIAVPGSKYLYIMTSYDASATEKVVTMPLSIKINGRELIQNKEQTNNVEYTTILFDDFETVNRDTWTFHTEAPYVGSKGANANYMSRFFTDENNVWAEQSTLVMKIAKDNSGEHGKYIDSDGNEQLIQYLAPYISTCDSYAIPKGRISAKIKTSKPSAKDFFMWCFWTFGQNAQWGYAHEMDIVEVVQKVFQEDAISATGVVIPAGSVSTATGFNLHYKKADETNGTSSTYKDIKIALKTNGVVGNDQIFYLNGNQFTTADWHIYTAEWDETRITILIDGNVFCTYEASAIGAVDENGEIGFKQPQDIRFNIKCKEPYSDNEGYLFIDWVKVESADKTPCTLINHDDITMTTGQNRYIKPTFNTNCSNYAYEMTTENTNIVSIEKYNNETSAMVVHKITALSPGTATVTIKSANNKVEKTFTVTVTL